MLTAPYLDIDDVTVPHRRHVPDAVDAGPRGRAPAPRAVTRQRLRAPAPPWKHRAMTRTGRLAWPTAAAVAVVVALGFLCGVHLGNLHNGLLGLSFAFVGALVVRHSPDPDSPGHREGRLFLLSGVASGVMFTCRQVGYEPDFPGAEWIAWFGVWPLPLVMVLVGLTIMSFPTGRLPSPLWRRLAVAATGVAIVLAAMSALWPVEYERTALLVAHPLGRARRRGRAGLLHRREQHRLLRLPADVGRLPGRPHAGGGRRAEPAAVVVRRRGGPERGGHGARASPSGTRRSEACSSSRSCRWRPGSRWSSPPTRRC